MSSICEGCPQFGSPASEYADPRVCHVTPEATVPDRASRLEQAERHMLVLETLALIGPRCRELFERLSRADSAVPYRAGSGQLARSGESVRLPRARVGRPLGRALDGAGLGAARQGQAPARPRA